MTEQLKPEARQIVKWLIDGHDGHDIAEAIRKQYPKADQEAAVRDALAHIRDQGQLDHSAAVGWAAESYRELYRKMVQVGDFANAIRAVKELTQLLKIKPPAPGGGAKHISIDDIHEAENDD